MAIAQDASVSGGKIAVTDDGARSFFTALILCCLGFCLLSGLHRFYTGKKMTGLLWLVTAGIGGLGTVYDLIVILCGSWRCKNGAPLYR